MEEKHKINTTKRSHRLIPEVLRVVPKVLLLRRVYMSGSSGINVCRHVHTQRTQSINNRLPQPSFSYSIVASHFYRTVRAPHVHTSVHTHRYDKAKVTVPHFVPGSDVEFNVTLTIDHGGQVSAPP